jgi:DNA repair protein RadD
MIVSNTNSVNGAEVLVVADPGPEWIEVKSVQYDIYQKLGYPPSLRVTYDCGEMSYREWICFEHEGVARGNAVRWWKARADTQPPSTIYEALKRTSELRTTKQIAVRGIGKFTEVFRSIL